MVRVNLVGAATSASPAAAVSAKAPVPPIADADTAKPAGADAGGATSSPSQQSAPAPSAATLQARQERERRRLLLRSANLEAWRHGPRPPPTQAPLDSNLKRNTAFLKKLRQGLGADAKEALLKDVASLSLEKYLEEVIQAVPEGLAKCVALKDISAASEILSALHQRFGAAAFALPLSSLLSSQLAPPSRQALQALPPEQRERDEATRVARQKVLLRGSVELALVELLRDGSGTSSAGQAATTGASSSSASAANKTKAASDVSSDAPAIEEASPGQEWLFGVLREMLVSDREHANVPILVAVLKAFGTILVPTPTTEGGSDVPADAPAPPHDEDRSRPTATPAPLVPSAARARLGRLCEAYFGTLARRVVREHARLREQERRNHEAYIRSGEIFEDRAQGYERMSKSFERTLEGAKSLSELLGLPLPELTDDSRSTGVGLAINLDAKAASGARGEEEFDASKSPWEDEDTRRFYEELADIGEMVPPALLGGGGGGGKGPAAKGSGWARADEGAKDATQTHADGEVEANIEVAKPDSLPKGPESLGGSPALATAELADPGNLEAAATSAAAGGASRAEEPSSSSSLPSSAPAAAAAQLGALLARLPELTNRAMIDSAAVEVAFLNSRAARRRLVKHLAGVGRNRLDLIPYYARLIATLYPYMSDVGDGVVELLSEEFRYLQRKRTADLAETRAKNLRFLGELTKFKVTPLHVIFYCLKTCLDDFSGANVDNVATLLETCGRFLLRTRETSDRMRANLELLRRKRAAQNLDQRQLTMLDNAYYQCNPPERGAVAMGAAAKKRPPMQLYIRHLIYDVLSKRTLERVLRQVRKLDWSDAQVVTWLRECFVRPWRVRHSHLYLLATLASDLQPYHPTFPVEVVDEVLEQVRVGMETNLFQHNQRRVATVQLLGELYNYRLVGSSVVLEQLWSLLTFGHAAAPGAEPLGSAIDARDDYFRLRLVCALLDTCGHCFDRGQLRARLDEVLGYAALYARSKRQPLPMDVEFMLLETLEQLRPGKTLPATREEALQEVEKLMAKYRPALAAANPPARAGDIGRSGGAPINHPGKDGAETREAATEKAARAAAAAAASAGAAEEAASADAERNADEASDTSASGDDVEDSGGSVASGDDAPMVRTGVDDGSGAEDEDEGSSDLEGDAEVDEDDDAESGASGDSEDVSDEEEEDDDEDGGSEGAGDGGDFASRRADAKAKADPLEEEAEDELERELAKMMAEPSAAAAGASGGAGSSGAVVGAVSGSTAQRNMLLHATIPVMKRSGASQQQQQLPVLSSNKVGASEASAERGTNRVGSAQVGSGPVAAAAEEEAKHMRFSLLSRKGNKQVTHEVHVPLDAALAVSTRTKQLQEEAERQRLKHLVLSSQTLAVSAAEEEERRGLDRDLARRPPRARFANRGG